MDRSLGIAVLAATLLATSTAPATATAADDPRQTAPGRLLHGDPGAPDISGEWLGTETLPPGAGTGQAPHKENEITRWAPWPPPLTPAYQQRADEIIAAARQGRQLGDYGLLCRPAGVPRMFASKNFPDEIIQTPGQVGIWLWGFSPIMIWTDGRPHPQNLQPSYNGHSIGYWVGDTLYVDTVGIRAETPVDSVPRTPHSGKLHIKTTIQLVNPETLHVHITLYDEDAFTEPMVTTNLWHRKGGPRWEMLDDASCFENNRRATDKSLEAGFGKF